MTRPTASSTAARRSRKSLLPAFLWRSGQLLAALSLVNWGAPILLSERSPEVLLRQGLMEAFQTEATPERLILDMDAALAAGEIDDALLLKEAADLAGVTLPQRQLDRLAAETTRLAQARRTAYDCGRGFILGAGEGAAGIGCAVISDFSVVGDVRDLARELPKENPNDLIVGLAAVGLALEAGMLVSLGATAPAKTGVSVAKSAARSGLLSGPLARELRVAVGEAVDLGRLRRGGRVEEAGGLLRADGLGRLTRPMGDLKAVYDVGGWRATRQVLKISDSADDVADGARAARALRADSAPVMRVLGKGALRGTKIVMRGAWKIASAIFAVIAGIFQILLVARDLLRASLRLVWWGLKGFVRAFLAGVRPDPRPAPRPAPPSSARPAPRAAPEPARLTAASPPRLDAPLEIPSARPAFADPAPQA
ncbi:hypothetical protein [Neomegalonema sp.]|uniref:hypothetical protein n=1 Tax=Neomegalonema sp. TaxID=2039713 RepID=UPI00260A385B|nr:hypothetical protein [Neomegalonema sp.]MDD2868832.1 hypothetical protein [Neomegalonema sp.]